MRGDVDEVPVVDPGAAYGLLIDTKPEAPDEVQGRGRGGAEARDVAGVLRNLGLDEHDVEGRREGGGAELTVHDSGPWLYPDRRPARADGGDGDAAGIVARRARH